MIFFCCVYFHSFYARMCGYDVFKGVSMSLRLKCVFIRQNISRKTECVLLLNAVYKLLHVRLRNIACFLSY